MKYTINQTPVEFEIKNEKKCNLNKYFGREKIPLNSLTIFSNYHFRAISVSGEVVATYNNLKRSGGRYCEV